jgi:uncharacterized protein YndB with AHSA1/START domain
MALTLETSVSVAAPADKVWAALTTPELVKQYFFGTQLVTDWKVGSPIYFRGEWEGQTYEDKGTVLEFDPLRRLRYNYWSSMSGTADKPENYANITYAVREEDGKSIVTITQDNIENEEKRAHSEQTWQMVMGDMKKLLEK